MRQLWIKVSCLAVLPLIALVLYGIWWGVAYRLPRAADKIIDMRTVHGVPGKDLLRLIFCAGLANNVHGFPGHAYVIWSRDKGAPPCEEALGYCPADYYGVIPSLYRPVQGVVNDSAAVGKDRNLEKLIVLVDQKTFDRTRRLADKWESKGFMTGSRDCCAFIDYIAKDAGLAVPGPRRLYPHDHIHMLKALNSGREQGEATVSAGSIETSERAHD